MNELRLRVLGSAAGGGFPQWNCTCRQCQAVRIGDSRYQARTQSSVALSRDAKTWALINASPDLLTQFKAHLPPNPSAHARKSGVGGVVLMDAQVDHVTGLVMLRENAQPIELHATPEVLSDLSGGFPILPLLSHYCGVQTHVIDLANPSIRWPWLPDARLALQPLPSKPPPYSRWRENPRPGDNLGLLMINELSGKSAFYAPGLGQMTEQTWQSLSSADIVLVDGTFWDDDEMIQQGLGQKTAQAMGHLALSGSTGLLKTLSELPAATRKILIHINNSNPILCADSPQRHQLDQLGVEVAYDGMEIFF